MDIIRNFINISGIADENELPKNINGQIIQYSESDTVFIPDSYPEINSLFQIMIKIDVNSNRKISIPFGTVMTLDGTKRLKIIYSSKAVNDKANFIELELPYNTFVELPKDIVCNDTKVYVLDAYFSILDGRKLYSHILYLVYVDMDLNGINSRIDENSGTESDEDALDVCDNLFEKDFP